MKTFHMYLPVFLAWACLAGTCLSPTPGAAQPALDSRHQLGLFSDVLADTVTRRDGTYPVAAPHLRLVLDAGAMPPGTGGDNMVLAALDCDGDGRDEVLLGRSHASTQTSQLLRNDGSGRFSPLAGTGLPTCVTGAARADLDNDGLCDLVLIGRDAAPRREVSSRRATIRRGTLSDIGLDALLAFRAVGGGRFVRLPLTGPPPGHPAAADWPAGGMSVWTLPELVDLDRDGRVDLIACEMTSAPGRTDITRERFWVFANRGDRLEAVRLLAVPVGDSEAMSTAASAVFDVDDDGWPDLTLLPKGGFFALRVPILAFLNRNGSLAARPDTLDVGHEPKAAAPCWYDADADGDFDLLAMQTDAQGGQHALYLRDGTRGWRAEGARSGLWSAYSLMTGAAWGDLDQDGLPDLIPCLNASDCSAAPIPVRRNLGQGRFGTVWEALSPPLTAALFTALCLDVDGDLDLDFISAPRACYAENPIVDPFLYRNVSRGGNALVLRLEGTRSNRSAIGALIEVQSGGRRQAMVPGGGGMTGALMPSLDVHVGLGAAAAAERVIVRWPSGLVETWDGLAAGKRWNLTEGSGTAAH